MDSFGRSAGDAAGYAVRSESVTSGEIDLFYEFDRVSSLYAISDPGCPIEALADSCCGRM